MAHQFYSFIQIIIENRTKTKFRIFSLESYYSHFLSNFNKFHSIFYSMNITKLGKQWRAIGRSLFQRTNGWNATLSHE